MAEATQWIRCSQSPAAAGGSPAGTPRSVTEDFPQAFLTVEKIPDSPDEAGRAAPSVDALGVLQAFS